MSVSSISKIALKTGHA